MNKFNFTQNTAQRFIQAGIDINAVLLSAGILVNKLPFTLTPKEFSNLMQAVAKHSKDPLLGVKIGHIQKGQLLDPATFVALHSANLAQSLDKLAKYKSLTCPEVVMWRIDDKQNKNIVIEHTWHEGVVMNDVLIDGFFANIASLVKLAIDQPPKAVYLTRTSINKSYQDYFNCPVYLNAPNDEIHYDSALLETSFETYNADLLSLILPSLDKQLPSNRLPLLAEQVKNVIFSMMNGNKPTLDNVAKHLDVSKRTLQRKLSNTGINYQILLDEVRLKVACEMLEKTNLENGEIAFYLGFDEVNSFHRFFVAQTGKTPHEWYIYRVRILC